MRPGANVGQYGQCGGTAYAGHMANLKDKTNKDLEEFFPKQEYNPKDMEFDLIYVNGNNKFEKLRREDET